MPTRRSARVAAQVSRNYQESSSDQEISSTVGSTHSSMETDDRFEAARESSEDPGPSDTQENSLEETMEASGEVTEPSNTQEDTLQEQNWETCWFVWAIIHHDNIEQFLDSETIEDAKDTMSIAEDNFIPECGLGATFEEKQAWAEKVYEPLLQADGTVNTALLKALAPPDKDWPQHVCA